MQRCESNLVLLQMFVLRVLVLSIVLKPRFSHCISLCAYVEKVWRRASVGDAGPLGGDFPIVTSDGHNILDVIFTTPIPSLGKSLLYGSSIVELAHRSMVDYSIENSAANVARSLDEIDGVVDHGLVIKTRLVSPKY